MALKFLNKKGWHTGSLRNIENVWKAEQKHDAEQKKLDELRKQIQEEREKSEFRLLQEQAGLIPKQERLDFLYDSGLAVGKGSSDGFKALESLPKAEADTAPSSSKQESSAPGALFEEKPQSANDAWRKLHSDPLLLIRQREQEALARIKNNPVQMANIRKSVEEKKKHKEKSGKKKEHKKHSHKNLKHDKYTASKGQISGEDDDSEGEERKKTSQHHNRINLKQYSSDDRSDSEIEEKRRRRYDKYSSSKNQERDKYATSKDEERHYNISKHNDKRHEQYSSHGRSDSVTEESRKRIYDKYSSSRSQGSERYGASKDEERYTRSHHHNDSRRQKDSSDERSDLEIEEKRKIRYDKYSSSRGQESEKYGTSKNRETYTRSHHHDDKKVENYPSNGRSDSENEDNKQWSHGQSKHERHSTQIMEAPNTNSGRPHPKKHRGVTKLSEEEKAARLREMQMDAVLLEEQRSKRLKKASEIDAQEASKASSMGGRSFLNDAQKSVYGAEKGGSSTIEESVRRRKYYSQGQSESNEGNAFRR